MNKERCDCDILIALTLERGNCPFCQKEELIIGPCYSFSIYTKGEGCPYNKQLGLFEETKVFYTFCIKQLAVIYNRLFQIIKSILSIILQAYLLSCHVVTWGIKYENRGKLMPADDIVFSYFWIFYAIYVLLNKSN